MNSDFIINLIKNDLWRMEVLQAVRSLNLPDWFIGAGFVRNPVWDALHNFEKQTPINDIDVAYFDPSDLSEETEIHYQKMLAEKLPANWSVTNQARMSKVNKSKTDYVSSESALACWPETATAIGVIMSADDTLKIIAPHGLDDLFSLKLRMSPDFEGGQEAFLKRVERKRWLEKWPKLEIVG